MVIFVPKLALKRIYMIKSIYTSFYLLATVVGLIVSLIHFGQEPNAIGRFAAVIAWLIGTIWWLYMFTMRLKNIVFAALVVSISTATALLISIGAHYVSSSGSLFSIRMSLTALVLWLIYHLFASRMRKAGDVLAKGNAFPNVPLFNSQGEPVHIGDFEGKKMLLFYRGKWCPICVDQGRDFEEELDRFEAAGVKLIAISTEEAQNAPSKVLFGLQDRDGELGEELGIRNAYALPFGLGLFGFKSVQNEPMGVLLDEQNRIIVARKPEDNRKRPSPGWFLRFLD